MAIDFHASEVTADARAAGTAGDGAGAAQRGLRDTARGKLSPAAMADRDVQAAVQKVVNGTLKNAGLIGKTVGYQKDKYRQVQEALSTFVRGQGRNDAEGAARLRRFAPPQKQQPNGQNGSNRGGHDNGGTGRDRNNGGNNGGDPKGENKPGVMPASLREAADRAAEEARRRGITAAIVISDPETGARVVINGDQSIRSASTIKLGVALAVAQAVDQGRLRQQDVQGDLGAMISQSNNEATNRLINQVGGFGAVNQAMQSMGISGSDASLGRNLGGTPPPADQDPNRMTGNGMDKILKVIQDSTGGHGAVSQASAARIMEAMGNQQVDTKFGAVLPNDQIAHKTGELGGATHDVGFFRSGDRWLQVSILTDNPDGTEGAGNSIIQEFATSVFKNRPTN